MNKSGMFNNDVWVIKKLRTSIPEDPFEVLVNGESMGMTKLLSFAKRVPYDSSLANLLLPVTPSSLNPAMPMFDSIHTDDAGRPNGNTPSYRIRINSITGPTTGPIMVRAFFNRSQNLRHDNMGIWAFQQAPALIKKGTTGSISYTVIAGVNAHSLEQVETRPHATERQFGKIGSQVMTGKADCGTATGVAREKTSC